MNILILSQRVPYPPNKGEKLRTYFQISHLLAQGHKVSVCTPTCGQEDVQSIRTLESIIDNPIVFEMMGHSFPRMLKGLLTFKALSVSNFYNNRLQKKFNQLIRENNFDALLCTSSSMAEYIFNSNELQTGPETNQKNLLLMDFMDLDSDKWKQYSTTSYWPMRWIYKREARLLARLEHRIQQTFEHCFFISQNEVDLFHKQIGTTQNVHVLGNGIDTSVFYPPEKKTNSIGPVFIFTGVMNYKPNIDAVLWFMKHAWGLIRNKYPEARFIIAGMNPSSAIQHLDRNPGIEVTGFIDDILPYYHQADYFIAPFTIARGVQNKILQAFACGLPVVTSSMGAEGIECKDGKHIIIAETGEEYLQAINKLESTPALKAKIIDAALTLIHEQYSWDGKLKALDSFLK